MLCRHFPSVEGFGVFPISLGGLGHQHLNVHMLILVYIFVVHYVSHFYYSSDYYSSSYSGIFWPVISDSGSFPDRVSSELGSAWSGSTTTLDAERLWRCYWLSFCATAHIYMFGVPSHVCFLLLGAELDAIFIYGGSTIRVCTFATLCNLPMVGICATWLWSLVHTWYA